MKMGERYLPTYHEGVWSYGGAKMDSLVDFDAQEVQRYKDAMKQADGLEADAKRFSLPLVAEGSISSYTKQLWANLQVTTKDGVKLSNADPDFTAAVAAGIVPNSIDGYATFQQQ